MSGKIMIVDDAPIIRLMLRDILEGAGHSVICECENGSVAVEKYNELKPDVVTMDIVMPKLSGIDALAAILGIDKNAKVIMISAIDQRQELMKAIKLGATDYIVKPFEADRVVSAISHALGAK